MEEFLEVLNGETGILTTNLFGYREDGTILKCRW